MAHAERASHRLGAGGRLWRSVQRTAESGRHSWVAAIVTIYYVGVQLYYWRFDVVHWDVLALSGWLTVTVGLRVAEALPDRLHQMLQRLTNRGLLPDNSADTSLTSALDDRSRRWSWIGGLAAAAVMFIASAVAFSGELSSRWPFLALAVPGGLLVGFHLGRMTSYGRLGAFLDEYHALPKVVPGHVDGAAGLKPIGDFFFFQAALVGIPALFLAVWWFLIPIGWPERYGYWRDPYLGMLVGAVLVEMFAFLAPMVRFHRHMVVSKRSLLTEADRLSKEITQLEAALAGGDVKDEGAIRSRTQQAREQYLAIEALPTWPVDTRTRRRFGLNNVGLLLPLVGRVIERSSPWDAIGDVLRNLQT